MDRQLPISELFEKYLSNQCTPDEIRLLLEYFKYPANEEFLRSLIEVELRQDSSLVAEDPSVNASVLKVRSILLSKVSKRAANDYLNCWMSVAAVLIVVFGTAITYYIHRKNMLDYITPVKIQEAITQRGERKTIQLTDGTKIWLAPGSVLKYPEQFRGSLREVKLVGEAFFEVAKDKIHPFIIHSGSFNTRVVGTSFTIRAFKGQVDPSVTVVAGIVQVSAKPVGPNNNTVVLKPNQKAVFDAGRDVLSAENDPSASLELKRKDGFLTYKGISVREIIADLSRYYNVPIVFKTKAADCLCYGEFDTNKPINTVLEQFTLAIGGRFALKDGKYLIRGGCKR